MLMMKLLIIRFSSIGDVTQSLSIVSHVKRFYPEAEVHFLTRSDMQDLFKHNTQIFKVWTIDSTFSFLQLVNFFLNMRSQNFTHIYDAHNNLRSRLARLLIKKEFLLVNRINRWKRFLLLQFHINKFEKPLSGQRELLKPLKQWKMPFQFPVDLPKESLFHFTADELKQVQTKFQLPFEFIVLVPTAAYELKRWPIEHWSQLIEHNKDKKFVVLAGPNDHFAEPLKIHKNVTSLVGQTSLRESIVCVSLAKATIANDTGLMHISEQMSKPTIALMGPAPFGFPSRATTKILESDLACRPCSKHGQGPCVNPEFQACLRQITPNQVSYYLSQVLQA